MKPKDGHMLIEVPEQEMMLATDVSDQRAWDLFMAEAKALVESRGEELFRQKLLDDVPGVESLRLQLEDLAENLLDISGIFRDALYKRAEQLSAGSLASGDQGATKGSPLNPLHLLHFLRRLANSLDAGDDGAAIGAKMRALFPEHFSDDWNWPEHQPKTASVSGGGAQA